MTPGPRRRAHRTEFPVTLVPGFENADLIAVLTGATLGFVLGQRLFANSGLRLAALAAAAAASYYAWFWFKERVGLKRLTHAVNWTATPDVLEVRQDANPVPLAIQAPAGSPQSP